MEYEKHINRLVLGYLRTNCKNTYKTFLKNNFQSPTKHIATRVGGQTLEDILRIYSQIQDIVQAHLEYTDYYKEHDSSPMNLAQQLLYLLDRGRPVSTPISTTVNDRSPCASSLAEEIVHEHVSDVETTPEHTLPGNSNDENSRTSFHTPYSENIPVSEHEHLSTVMSKTLLKKSSFPEKLARNINAVLNTPEFSNLSARREESNSSDAEKNKLNVELEDTIQKALTRTEADPMFEGLLEDFLEPIANSFEKAITAEAAAITNKLSGKKYTPSPEKYTNIDEHNIGAISSILAVSNSTNQGTESQNETRQVTSTEQISYQVTPTKSQNKMVERPMEVNNQPVYQQMPQTIYSIPRSQQQQFVIMNRPLMMSQSGQIMQIIQTAPNVTNKSKRRKSKGNFTNLTEQDIMAMPTIILNEKNEIITHADSLSFPSNNTTFKSNEVYNIKEYFNAFGNFEHSPIIKCGPLKPTPTIKVEIYQRDTPFEATQSVPNNETSQKSSANELPNIADDTEDVIVGATEPSSEISSKKTPNECRVELAKPRSLSSICTPSPVAKKPTPKTSSHVRNLTFPSPLRKTAEKDNESRNSPSALSKQQAAKDLFKNKTPEKKSPKKTNDSPKKTIKKKEPKNPFEHKTPESWDTALRKPKNPFEHNIPESWDTALRKSIALIPEESNNTTPFRRTSTRKRIKRSTDTDNTDPDGKKLEESLKTPKKPAKKSKSKTSQKKKPATKQIKNKPQKLSPNEEEEKEKIEAKTTVLSPSKLCNTASKRNMEVDGITPTNSSSIESQVVSTARKNISAMLDTPLKEVKTNNPNTPFTPMLKANLQGLTDGDNFAIDTPNFPITPGLDNMIEHSSVPYYNIIKDTETDKATEAIVLSEERKSSVRKTDEEDVDLSPKVYGCKEILKEFNHSQIGKKNLNLINQEGVQWDGKSDNSEETDEETNNTVINTQNTNARRGGGKSMSMLKNLKDEESMEIFEETNNFKQRGISSSNDSEIVSKANHKNSQNLNDIIEEGTNNKICDKEENESDKNNVSISTITSETIKEAVLTSTLTRSTSHITSAYSVKAELDEKRRRIIELEKTKTPHRKQKNEKSKSKPKSNLSSNNKRKRTVPKKMQKNLDLDNEDYDNNKVNSQDDFFKKSGTNLHRKQMEKFAKNEKNCNKITSKSESMVEVKELECKEAFEGQSNSNELTKSPDISPLDESVRVLRLQPKEICIKYDPKNSSKKRLEDYDLDLLKKGFGAYVPLDGGGSQFVQTMVTPFKFLMEINPCEGSSDSENVDEFRGKKRKHRSGSTNSNTSSKKIKTSLISNSLGNTDLIEIKPSLIEKVLTQLHGPDAKT